MKGAWTRCVKNLQKEAQIGQDLIPLSGDVSDKTEFIGCNSCIESLQLYYENVEDQTEKLAEKVGDSDKELIKELVSENETLCDEVIECVTKLKQFKGKFSAVKIKQTEANKVMG